MYLEILYNTDGFIGGYRYDFNPKTCRNKPDLNNLYDIPSTEIQYVHGYLEGNNGITTKGFEKKFGKYLCKLIK